MIFTLEMCVPLLWKHDLPLVQYLVKSSATYATQEDKTSVNRWINDFFNRPFIFPSVFSFSSSFENESIQVFGWLWVTVDIAIYIYGYVNKTKCDVILHSVRNHLLYTLSLKTKESTGAKLALGLLKREWTPWRTIFCLHLPFGIEVTK